MGEGGTKISALVTVPRRHLMDIEVETSSLGKISITDTDLGATGM